MQQLAIIKHKYDVVFTGSWGRASKLIDQETDCGPIHGNKKRSAFQPRELNGLNSTDFFYLIDKADWL